MTVSEDKKLDVLFSHYNSSYTIVNDSIKIREKMLLLIIILIGIQFFQISDPDSTTKATSSFLKMKLGIDFFIDKQSITATLWFSLLACVIRYYQINIYINRLYNYIHKLENKFVKFLDKGDIDREGKSYLKNYPIFSNWIHFIYTWAFPILLLLVTVFKIYNDFPGYKYIKISYIISSMFFLFIWISTILYLISLHFKKKGS